MFYSTGNIQTFDFIEKDSYSISEVTLEPYWGATVNKVSGAASYYSITSEANSSDSTYGWGSGVKIAESSKIDVPYGYWCKITYQVKCLYNLSFAYDFNNLVVGGDNWNGNDNDVVSSRIFWGENGDSITGGLSSWKTLYFCSYNGDPSNVLKLPLRIYSGLGALTSETKTQWFVRGPLVEIFRIKTDNVRISYQENIDNCLNANILDKKYTEEDPFIAETTSTDGYQPTYQKAVVTPGETYYITAKTDCEWSPSHDTEEARTGHKVTLWMYLSKDWTAYEEYDDPVLLCKNNNYWIKDGLWKITIPSDRNYVSMRVNQYSDGTTSITAKFWDIAIIPEKYYNPSNTEIVASEIIEF